MIQILHLNECTTARASKPLCGAEAPAMQWESPSRDPLAESLRDLRVDALLLFFVVF